MKIMTFNLRTDFIFDLNNRWEKRSKVVYSLINNYNCDVIGVQELNLTMFQDISNNLKEYTIVGEQRSKKLFIEKNDILISKRHKVLECETFRLPKYKPKGDFVPWYSIYPRICTTALIKLNTGEKVRIYNTHLDCFSSQARNYGLKKIREYIEEKNKKENVPIILMGDFNAIPNSKLIKNFTAMDKEKKHFVAVQEYNKDMYNMSTMSNFKDKSKGPHIDYIFISEEFEIEYAEIIKYNVKGRYPSDHYPILAEIKLKKKKDYYKEKVCLNDKIDNQIRII